MNGNEPPGAQPGPESPRTEDVETIDTAVLDAIEAASPPPAPAIDPWSRTGAGAVARPEASPPAVEEPPRPRGWEWSRSASAGVAWAPSLAESPQGPAPPPDWEATKRRPETSAGRLRLELLALSMALVGGLMALVGAFFQELQSGVGVFLLVLAAPVIEEVLKPSGIYVLLVKWPQALRGQLHTAFLCAVSGAVFGVIESLVYVELYYPNGSDAFVLFRFTVTPVMHAIASFIVGYGLSRSLLEWANGRSPLPQRTRNGYLFGIGLHAVYNTSVVVLGLLGILDFLETVLLR
jgi:hypothetical protein